jgi:predicted transcriptional regulator
MKVVKVEKKQKHEKTSFTMRLDEDLLKKVDRIANDAGISRQKLVEAIIRQAVNDKDFAVEVS